ncbi:MAG: hypothetical protein KHY89_06825 [Butyricicoccus pullicaecorum]|nr:hypothetical protein [Butyricicoccus pullicaecorum]
MVNWKWVGTITALSFLISVSMSYLSNEALKTVNNVVAFFILLLFVAIGIVFDIIGVAATSTTEKELHSMAAKKVHGARQAVWLSRNAEKVASFCNDVVGDISGIISGATGAIIISHITSGLNGFQALIVSLTVTGCIAAATIGGKAIGKVFGISKSVVIIHTAGRILAFLHLPQEKKR